MTKGSLWRTWKPYAALIVAIAGGSWWYTTQSTFATLKDGEYGCTAVFVNASGEYEVLVDESGDPHPALAATVRDGTLVEMAGLPPEQLTTLTLKTIGTEHFQVTDDPAAHSYNAVACDLRRGIASFEVPTAAVTTPEATPATIAAGQVLTETQALEPPDNVCVHTMNDGSKVAVVKGEPVPQVVSSDILIQANEVIPLGLDATKYLSSPHYPRIDLWPDLGTFEDELYRLGREICREVLFVRPAFGHRTAEDLRAGRDMETYFIAHTSYASDTYDTLEEALAAVTPLAETNPSYMVLVFPS